MRALHAAHAAFVVRTQIELSEKDDMTYAMWGWYCCSARRCGDIGAAFGGSGRPVGWMNTMSWTACAKQFGR